LPEEYKLEDVKIRSSGDFLELYYKNIRLTSILKETIPEEVFKLPMREAIKELLKRAKEEIKLFLEGYGEGLPQLIRDRISQKLRIIEKLLENN